MGNSMNEAKWDSSGWCSWVGTPVIESTLFFFTLKTIEQYTLKKHLLDTRNMMLQKVIKRSYRKLLKRNIKRSQTMFMC